MSGSQTLTQANLTKAFLYRANLNNANFTNANLTKSYLDYTDFSGIDLSSVNLTEASIFYAHLENALNIPANVLCLYAPLPKNNPNTQLVNTLRQRTKGLRMGSEGDYPYEIFLWDVEGKGEFSLEGILRQRNELERVELDYFWQTLPNENLSLEQKFLRAYQTFVESLQPQITDLEVYHLKTARFPEFSKAVVYIILAKTKAGDWLGLSVALDSTEIQELKALPMFEIRDFALTKPENVELVIAIESALDKANALIPEMRDVREFIWEIGEKRDSLFQNLVVATKHFTIQEYTYKDYGDDDEDDEKFSFSFNFDKYTNELINTSLTNLRYYFVGAVEIDIYLVGQAKNKDFIGIRTTVVWT